MCICICTRVFKDIQYQCFRGLKVLTGARSRVRVSGTICPSSACAWTTSADVCVYKRAIIKVHCVFR